MAIVIKQQKKGIDWFVIVVFAFFFLVVVIGSYFLFFTEAPLIEAITPTTLRSVVQISTEAEIFDPSEIISNPVLKKLRQYGGLPSVGNLGRDNPFLSF